MINLAINHSFEAKDINSPYRKGIYIIEIPNDPNQLICIEGTGRDYMNSPRFV